MATKNEIYFLGNSYNIKSIIRNYDKVSGWRTQITVEGTDVALNTFINQYKNIVSEFQITGDDILKTLTLTINDNWQNEEEIEYNWEVNYNEYEESILNHPMMMKYNPYAWQCFKAISEGKLTRELNDEYGRIDGAIVLQYRTKARVGVDSIVDEIVDFYPVDVSLASEAIDICRLILMGIDSYLSSNLVLRRTTNVISLENYQFETQYLNCVLSKEVFINKFNVPEYIQQVLPDLSGFPVIPENDFNQSKFFWGYLIKGSQANFLANGKLEIAQEYWYGCWSTLLYKYYNS